MFFGGFILNGIRKDIGLIFMKLDAIGDKYQSKESCKIHHDAHDKEHATAKEISDEKFGQLKTDINNVANMTRGAKR